MMTHTLTDQVTLVTHQCGKCGVTFAMPKTMHDTCLRDHRQTFYCPNGHQRAFVGKTEAEKLREQLQWANSQATHARDQLRASERSNAALKGVVTRTKKRIGNGHMANQHPDYAEGEEA